MEIQMLFDRKQEKKKKSSSKRHYAVLYLIQYMQQGFLSPQLKPQAASSSSNIKNGLISLRANQT